MGISDTGASARGRNRLLAAVVGLALSLGFLVVAPQEEAEAAPPARARSSRRTRARLLPRTATPPLWSSV